MRATPSTHRPGVAEEDAAVEGVEGSVSNGLDDKSLERGGSGVAGRRIAGGIPGGAIGGSYAPTASCAPKPAAKGRVAVGAGDEEIS